MKSMMRLQVLAPQFAGRVGRQRMPPARRPESVCPLMRLSWAVRTDPGLRRSSNEDSYCTRADLGLFVVADGMGGHVAGEVASRIAVETIQTFIAETAGADKNRTWPFPFDPSISLDANRLKAAFRLANRQIANAMADAADLRGMATTASAVLAGRTARVRRARRRQPRLRAARAARSSRLTHDHSWVEEQVRAGDDDPDAPRGSTRGATSSRARWPAARIREIDVVEFEPQPGERFLLCSDGLFTRRPARHDRAEARTERRRPRGRSARR